MVEKKPLHNSGQFININTVDKFLEASGIEIKEKFLSRNNKIILASILKTPLNGTLENEVKKLENLKVLTRQDVENIIENYEHQNFLSNDDSFLGSETGVYSKNKTLSSFPGQKKQLNAEEQKLLKKKIKEGYTLPPKPSDNPWV